MDPKERLADVERNMEIMLASRDDQSARKNHAIADRLLTAAAEWATIALALRAAVAGEGQSR